MSKALRCYSYGVEIVFDSALLPTALVFYGKSGLIERWVAPRSNFVQIVRDLNVAGELAPYKWAAARAGEEAFCQLASDPYAMLIESRSGHAK